MVSLALTCVRADSGITEGVTLVSRSTNRYRPQRMLVLGTFAAVSSSLSVVLGEYLPVKRIRSVSERGPSRGE